MSKILAIAEALACLKELWDSASEFLTEVVPNNFYELMDKLAFLDANFLYIESSGKFLDKTQNIANAIMDLSNFVIWGILLFFGFKSLFSYFISKKVDIPWKMFIRVIIFGVLANSAFFICYSGVFFAENCTKYIREYAGESNTSFTFLEECIDKNDLETEKDEEKQLNIYTVDALISLFIFFSSFLLSVCLGGRYILLRVLMLLSPVFFLACGIRDGEKMFIRWCKVFFSLLFMQVIFAVSLGVVSFMGSKDNTMVGILLCALLLLFNKFVFGFLKLSM